MPAPDALGSALAACIHLATQPSPSAGGGGFGADRIAAAVTPAVMVSACALIALGLDNQVSRMAMRLRELAREYRGLPDAHPRRALLQAQVAAFDSRHRILTRALQLDYGSLLAFIVTSLLELSSALLPIARGLALIPFGAGVILLCGVSVDVMRSLHQARVALSLERRELEGGMPESRPLHAGR
jgi:hypothetical protein